jgi:K+-sensing histidine kinase KdpD
MTDQNDNRSYTDPPTKDQTRLEALYQVSRALGTSLKLDDVLEQVMESVINLTGAERGFLILTHSANADLSMRIGRNINQDALDKEDMVVSRSVIRETLNSGNGVVTTNAQEDPRFAEQESVVMHSFRSIMCAPLLAGGNLLGVIYVDSRMQIGVFDSQDLELLEAFASQAAAAIANAQQYDRTDRFLTARLRELEELSRFAKVLNTQNTLQEMLETTQKWAIEHTETENVWIAVSAENEAGDPILRVVVGEHTGQELVANHPVISEALRGSTPHIFEPQDGQPARMVVPLLGEEHTLGILVAEAGEEFSNEDVQFLTRLTNQAAVAFGKAQLYQQISESKAETAKFVSVVSHELRIPMTSIMGYTDLLKQGVMGELNENQHNFLGVIRENVGRMSTLISNLSDINKAQTDRLHLDIDNVSIYSAAVMAKTTILKQLDAKHQTLDIQIDPELPPVKADPARVEQLIGILLENASMYSGERTQIEVHAKAEGDFLQIMVKDEGIGISPEDQVMIFEQFFRSEAEEVREQKGWGLSLAVVKNLAELMGGEASFESIPGEGSTFWFTLPLA